MTSAFVGPAGGQVGPGGTTLADLIARLRIELHDEDASRWEDDVLERHLARAVNELSLASPRAMRTTLTTTTAGRELGLTGLPQLIRVEAVEFPAGTWPSAFVRFSVFGTTLTLLSDRAPAAGESVRVYWSALHHLDTWQSTLPVALEEVALTGAAGYAALEWAGFATNRANLGGTDAVDDYRAWAEDRLRQFRTQLEKLGESARVRAGQLFAPGAPLSRDTVQWEA